MKCLLFLLLCFAPGFALSADLNAGFVQGLWYSKTPFFAGETVRIYTAIQNNSGFDIQGTVEFLLNGAVTGKSNFSAVQGRIVDVWTDWKVSQGNQELSAKIVQAFKLEIGKDPEPIVLANAVLGTSQVFVDLDTDKDGLGNTEDPDDDNDLLSDAAEKELGTNPLEADSDQDGVPDGKEVSLATNPLNQDTDNDGKNDGQELREGTNPLVAQQKTTQQEPRKQQGTVQELTKKLTQEYLPTLEQRIDEIAKTTTEQLQKQRETLSQKKGDAGTLGVQEQAFDMLLAAAIVGLDQWQLALFLAFGIIVALVLRRLARKEE